MYPSFSVKTHRDLPLPRCCAAVLTCDEPSAPYGSASVLSSQHPSTLAPLGSSGDKEEAQYLAALIAALPLTTTSRRRLPPNATAEHADVVAIASKARRSRAKEPVLINGRRC